MSTEDISRFLFQPSRHYAGARLQQGRALVDSDFNEEAKSDDEDSRLALADIVGCAGSPNDGFTPELTRGQTVAAVPVLFGGVVPVFILNFGLRPGSIVLGGMRFELEASEPVVFQKDFLQMSPGDAPLAEIGTRQHLVFLRGWEQHVTAVEDEEILEGAMGGADSTSRVRRMRRVETRRVDATEPGPAFAEVIADITQDGGATFDEATCELRSNARMHIDFLTTNEPSQCPPCDRSQVGQYLGSENNAYRIMLATASSYVWAFDDGAPLYRVKVFLTGADARVEMLTPPKDSIHFPTENAVVEFLPWSALLDNGEKAANLVGFFGEVVTPYSNGDRSFTVRLAPESLIELGFIARKVAPDKAKSKAKLKVKTGGADRIHTIAVRWDPHHPQAADLNPSGGEDQSFVAFVYMRIWHQRAANEPFLVPTTAGLPLGRTGLVPRFSGLGRPGDYWVVAARPSAPSEVVPLELLRPEGVPPHGPREFLTPLTLIEWESLSSPFLHRVKSLRDGRSPFAPITEGDCCTLVVSDSGGGFTSIQGAIDALPASGGRICVQPGLYQEEVFLDHRTNIVIEGCGPETIIETPASPSGDSLVQIIGPDLSDASIELRRLTLRAHGQTGVLATGEKITLRDLDITTDAGSAPETLPAIAILVGRDIRILNNKITMDGTLSNHAAVYVESPILGTLIEQNTIFTLHNQTDGLCFAWGGVHIAGNSRSVEIRRNNIAGGLGHGITLGSVIFRADAGTQILERRRQGAGKTQIDPAPPHDVNGQIVSFVDGGETYHPQSEGPLEDILIAENLIAGSSNSGISTIAIVLEHDDVDTGPPLCLPGEPETFDVLRLTIVDNIINGNVVSPPEDVELPHVIGGIILSGAHDLTVRGNRIEGNGFETESPVCGFFAASGENFVIDSNMIRANGSPVEFTTVPDVRGGIVFIPLASGSESDLTVIANRIFIWNNIVEVPEGPSLLMLARGSCSIVGNHLSSNGCDVPNLLGAGSSVTVINAGAPWEALNLAAGEPSQDRWIISTNVKNYIQGVGSEAVVGEGGAVGFHDNEVVTNWENGPTQDLAVLVVSLDSVTAKGNQLSLRQPALPAPTPTPTPTPTPAAGPIHSVFSGFLVCGAKNRFAETVDGAAASAAIAGFMSAGVHNISTHCLFVAADDTNSFHFADHGNLRLLTPNTEDECGDFAFLGVEF